MIIVDTNIWIEYLKQNREYVDDINLLLKSRFIVAFEPIFAELLYGARFEKEKEVILNFWKVLPKLESTEPTMLEAAIYANKHNFHNSGIGLIDAMIISTALDTKSKIWTLDKKVIKCVPKSFVYSMQSNYKDSSE